MKSVFIAIGAFSLLAQVYAVCDVVLPVATQKSAKSEILLEVKHLTQRYEMLKSKQQAWEERKKVLIKEFSQINDWDIRFGAENRYGVERIKRRFGSFNASIKERDNELKENLTQVKQELANLEALFLATYGYAIR